MAAVWNRTLTLPSHEGFGTLSMAVCLRTQLPSFSSSAEEGVSEDTEHTSTASKRLFVCLFVCQDVNHLVTSELIRKVGNELVSRKEGGIQG